MRICVAQTASLKGRLKENIETHLLMINQASEFNSDLIIFPELSITNYETALAQKLAANINDKLFDPFRELSDQKNITIGIGMPTTSPDGIRISMLLFQPQQKSVVYSKQILDPDEIPYFTAGSNQIILSIKGKKVAFGICYEALQEEHFLDAQKSGFDIYIASVAMTQSGIHRALEYFPKMAEKYNTPILLSNCIGSCDSILTVGQSSVWDQKGLLVEQLDDKNQGVIIYDTESGATERYGSRRESFN